ncbi:hypothetical protein GW17_00044204 [Ensete ventricosum]|uniref:Uncharacterized protein n=1 Tax=Ensete ventricosum TaxID=4639 RepID=A0A426Z0H9_ENSVE|nr:hypothetical protein B296_00031892 [Ensete ventricosum]RWV93347.1 hypothetical protein GW17_00044204 [Ensete ventricosum]RZR76244.1 hypothetical protein BHM03_00000908 [Ensete ventricosum]
MCPDVNGWTLGRDYNIHRYNVLRVFEGSAAKLLPPLVESRLVSPHSVILDQDDARQVRIRCYQLGPIVAASIAKEGDLLRAEPVPGLSRWRQVIVDAGNPRVQQPHGVPFSPFLGAPLADLVGEPVLRALPVLVGPKGV